MCDRGFGSVGSKKVIKQLTSIEYSLVFSRPYDGQVHSCAPREF